MDYKVIDILRSPTIIILDTLISRRLKLFSTSIPIVDFVITTLGSIASLSLLACQQNWLVRVYRFIAGLIILFFSTSLQIILVASCFKNYQAQYPQINQSVTYQLVFSTLRHGTLNLHQVDLSLKVLCFLSVQFLLHLIFTSKHMFPTNPGHLPHQLSMLCLPASTIVALFNLPEIWFNVSIFITLLPQFLALYSNAGQGISHLCSHSRKNIQGLWRSIKEQGLPIFVERIWEYLRVPQVLRIYFLFRLSILTVVILTSTTLTVSNNNENNPQGILHYFVKNEHESDITVDNQTRKMTNEKHSAIETNFNALEYLEVMLTDSMLSVFSLGSAISVPFYYFGIQLHNFVGGVDLGHAQSLGSVSSILFCLLAIQTGLTGLSPPSRLIRLYRNLCLLFAAVFHYTHDLVHPVLMNLSAQVNIPIRKHFKPLLVSIFLIVVPTIFCWWLIKNKPVSTWLIALTAFSIELIVKVIATLLLYVLFALDARIAHKPWPHLDDWVFYVQSTSHTIEFICGCVMFLNGAYVLFFESGSALRAFMMSMHAYVNIYKAACDGWKTLHNRRTVNSKLSTLERIDQFGEHEDDVCSICYQNFTEEYGEVRRTRCKHLFHSSCLRKWLYIQDTCPMCHQTIFLQDKKDS